MFWRAVIIVLSVTSATNIYSGEHYQTQLLVTKSQNFATEEECTEAITEWANTYHSKNYEIKDMHCDYINGNSQ